MEATAETPLQRANESAGERRASRGGATLEHLMMAMHHQQHDKEEIEEEENQVDTVELFSDLVVVVAIHTFSDQLVELEDGATSVDWYWFWVGVFLLWYIWHGLLTFTNIAHVMSNDRRQLGFFEYCIVFVVMALIVLMTKRSDVAAVGFFFFGRVLQELANIWETTKTWATTTTDDITTAENRRRRLQLGSFLFLGTIFVEMFPFGLVWILGYGQNDIAQIAAGIATIIISMSLRRFYVIQLERSMGLVKTDNGDENGVTVANGNNILVDLGLLEERYELMVLIFLGELCFASVSTKGTYVEALCALLAAVGCYLHYFTARSTGQVLPWRVSIRSNLIALQLHILLFWTVPVMGIAFVQSIDKEHEEGEEEGEEDEAGHDHELHWFEHSKTMLSMATGVFLVIVAGLEWHSQDSPTAPQPRLTNRVRAMCTFGFGVMIACSSILMSNTVMFMPQFLIGTALIHIWMCSA